MTARPTPLRPLTVVPGPDPVPDGSGTSGTSGTTSDAVAADRAWRAGDLLTAIVLADHALAAGDAGGPAAAVAAAGAAADGALLDAAARWHGVAAGLDGAEAARATGRAALAAGLAGDAGSAARLLAEAHRLLPDPAPRGLTVLLGGVGAVVEAMHGQLDRASRHLAGLAAATVAADPLAAERWDDLAVVVTAAGGDVGTARDALRGRPGAPTARGRLLAAWLALRTGHLTEAGQSLATAATPLLRRDAILAAAVGVGLARRSGDPHALPAAWHRISAVVAGADVEPLLIDVWGELSVAAKQMSAPDQDVVVDAIHAAVVRAGSPWWAVGAEQWWRLERAVAAEDAPAAEDAAARLAELSAAHPRLAPRSDAAGAWAALLADRVRPRTVDAAMTRLADAGLYGDAAALCRAAVQRTEDPTAARELLLAGRSLRATAAPGRPTAGRPRTHEGLSDREREVGALVVDGLTHREIGARLYISPKTVEQHVARLRQKLAASNRATLVAALRPHLEG